MRAGPYTLQTAIRRAGATRVALRPDAAPPRDVDALLRHCGHPMDETLDPDTRAPVRYRCATCGTDITHIDGHGQPASISPDQRRRQQRTGELWTVGTDPLSVTTSRGPGGTAHR